jgi:hypothetical protein
MDEDPNVFEIERDRFSLMCSREVAVGECLRVMEAESVEQERLEMLGLIEDLLITIKTSTVHGSLIFYDRAKAFLRVHEGDSRG